MVGSLTPLWDSTALRVMDGVAIERREVIVTSVVDAASLYRQKSAAPSIWPIVAALAVTAMFLGSIFTPWAIVAGALPIAAALTGWFWPQRGREDRSLAGATMSAETTKLLTDLIERDAMPSKRGLRSW